MRFEIHGTTMPVLDIYLNRGETLFTEAGGMAWMVGDILMDTNSRGGLLKGLARTFAGESLFLTNYTCQGSEAMISFAPEIPGTIVTLELGANESRICQKDAFMVAHDSVTLETHFRRKLGTGLFGGEGFVLQKLTGPGFAWLEIGGEVRSYNLKAGQTMKVNPGHIAMYEPSIDYSIERVKGLKNMLWGGEGLFLATLTGPGTIWLQTLPFSSLASKLLSYLPATNNS